jgi:hypothetical protein
VSIGKELPDVTLCRLVRSYRTLGCVDWYGVTGRYAVSTGKKLPDVTLCRLVLSYGALRCVDW